MNAKRNVMEVKLNAVMSAVAAIHEETGKPAVAWSRRFGQCK